MKQQIDQRSALNIQPSAPYVQRSAPYVQRSALTPNRSGWRVFEAVPGGVIPPVLGGEA